jgi:hypothetical protein
MPRQTGITMTREELLALPVSFPLITAGRAFGMGRDKTLQLYRAGQLPFPALPSAGPSRSPAPPCLRRSGSTRRANP